MLKKNRKGYLYLLPALIILSVFVFYPIINTIIFSFDETKAKGFVFGFGSYKYLFQDKRFLQSLLNTAFWRLSFRQYSFLCYVSCSTSSNIR